MAITEANNPLNPKQKLLVCSGKIDGIYFNPIKNQKTYKNGWTPTHFINVKVDGQAVNFGMTDKDKLLVKDENDKFLELQRGMEISVPVEKSVNGEYENYNANAKNVVVLDDTPELSAQQGNSGNKASGGSYVKRDNTGMQCGHAQNGAMRILNGKLTSVEEFIEIAKAVHNATEAVKAKYAEIKPELDDYALGASVGNAINNMCDVLTKTKVDQLEQKTLSFLQECTEPLLAYIRGEQDDPEEQDEEGQEEFDDDIPFS